MDFVKSKLVDHYRWGKMGGHDVKYDLPNPFPFITHKSYIGIEVEVENIRKWFDYNREIWNIKEDGSLRNNGREFVSVPIRGSGIQYAIENLFTTLPAEVDFSERTSIHVHFNVRAKTVEELFNIVVLYIVFEKLLYNFAGAHRYGNIFCVPLQETRLPTVLSNFLQSMEPRVLVQGWSKYSGLNLLPVNRFGTIEYRHMMGHRNAVKLMQWINIIFRMHRYAQRITFMELYNQIKVLNSDSLYGAFLMSVFDEDAQLLMGRDLQQEMENGVSTVKGITLPSPFQQQLQKDLSYESPLFTSLGITKQEKQTIHARMVAEPFRFENVIRELRIAPQHYALIIEDHIEDHLANANRPDGAPF